jgi:hypothetical protein
VHDRRGEREGERVERHGRRLTSRHVPTVDLSGRVAARAGNAGMMALGPFEQQSGDGWRWVVEARRPGLLHAVVVSPAREA